MSAAGHWREKRHLACAFQWHGEINQRLIHGDPHGGQIGKRQRIAVFALFQFLDQIGDRGGLAVDLFARQADAFTDPGEVKHVNGHLLSSCK